MLPEIKSGVAVEFQRAERTAVFDFLPVVPGSHNQEYLVVIRVLRF